MKGKELVPRGGSSFPFPFLKEKSLATMKSLSYLLFGIGFFLFLLGNAHCNSEVKEPMKQKPIEEVLKAHTDHLMSIGGVLGTAIGESDGKPCIKVYVVKKTKEIEQKIPAVLEGHKVVIEETGEFRALERK